MRDTVEVQVEQAVGTMPGRLSSWQDDASSTTSRSRPAVPPATALQMELKELRATLESKSVDASQQAGMIGDKRMQELMSEVAEIRTLVTTSQMEQASFLQMMRSEMDMLRKQVSTLGELDEIANCQAAIGELRTQIQDHHQWRSFQDGKMDSALSGQESLMLDLNILKQEVRSIQDHTQLQKSKFESEMKSFKLESSKKIDEQVTQVKDTYAEVQKIQELVAKGDSRSAAAEEVQKLSRTIEEVRTNHGALKTVLESEVKSLKQTLGEKDLHVAATTEGKLAEFQSAVLEHQKETLETLSNFQTQIERVQRKQDEDYVEATCKNDDLLAKTRSDMDALRDLLGKAAPHDNAFAEESLAMIKTLQGEVDHLRQRQEEAGAEGSQSAPTSLQTQAELRELRSLLQQQQALADQAALAQQIAKQAQRLEVETVQQQVKEQKAQLESFSTTAQGLMEVRERETQSIRSHFEQQLQQHSDMVMSLNTQVGNLSQGLETMRALPTQALPATTQFTGDAADVAEYKAEVEGLKRQLTSLRTMTELEGAKKEGAIQEKLDMVIGIERDARLQDSIETRALIKNLYEEVAKVAQNIKEQPAVSTSDSAPRGSCPPRLAPSGGYPGDSNMSIKHVDVTRYIGAAGPDSA